MTIYHWDLPQCIQDLGGWCNKQIIEFFTLYVRVVFRTFGDRVCKNTFLIYGTNNTNYCSNNYTYFILGEVLDNY